MLTSELIAKAYAVMPYDVEVSVMVSCMAIEATYKTEAHREKEYLSLISILLDAAAIYDAAVQKSMN